MTACIGGIAPQTCPYPSCPGCRRVFIHCPGHEQRPGRAQLCPVCKGSGNLWTVGPDAVSGNVGNVSRRCHGCDGKGWVAVFEAPGEDDK